MCLGATRVFTMGQVMLVTTGIGHDRAALCLNGILQFYTGKVKEIIFLGTGVCE